MWAKKQTGFTIVELLIVIVVIAILAAIAITAYTGVQNKARVSAVSSALSQATKKLATYAVDGNGYPTDLASVGISNTSSVDYQYSYNNSATPATYCITATSGSTSYKASSASTTPSSGGCAGHGVGGTAAITNLVTNPSFETGLAGYGFNVSNFGTRTQSTSAAYTGTYGHRITATSTGTGISGFGAYIQVPNLASDKSYSASVWVRSSASMPYVITLERRNSSNANIGTSTSPPVTLAPNTWTRLTHSIPATATMTQLTFCVYSSGASVTTGDTIDFDGLMFVEGTSAPAYADGSSTDWMWNGAAHGSTSTGPAS